jgi:peroxiredoxin
MTRNISALIGLLICGLSYAQYDIAVQIDGLSCDDELLLANHFGDKQYLKDTAECSNGVFHFKGEEKLESGVYLIVLPKKNYFEVLVSVNENQMEYSFVADTTLKPKKMFVSGSKENELFLEFNVFAVEQSLTAAEIRKEMDAEENEKKKESLKETLVSIGESVAVKRQEIQTNYPGLFIAKLYHAMSSTELPENPKEMDEEELKKWQYLWLRKHYWDKLDMSEDGLVRSPVFHNMLKNYFKLYMPPLADTAIMMGDNLINRIEVAGSKEQYKYTIHFLLGYFEDAKYMCFDKAVWHMAKNYYCAGKAFWADSAYVEKMCVESSKMEPTLCGQLAPELMMPDTNFKQRISMSQINKPVTVLVFWDINCGHCKKEMPIISDMYDSMTNKNVEIYAVYTQGDWEGWKKRIAKDQFKFINVANAFGEDKFRAKYNIRTTPQIFILDENKNIRFKKIGAKDIPSTVQYLLEEQGVVPKKKEKSGAE